MKLDELSPFSIIKFRPSAQRRCLRRGGLLNRDRNVTPARPRPAATCRVLQFIVTTAPDWSQLELLLEYCWLCFVAEQFQLLRWKAISQMDCHTAYQRKFYQILCVLITWDCAWGCLFYFMFPLIVITVFWWKWFYIFMIYLFFLCFLVSSY